MRRKNSRTKNKESAVSRRNRAIPVIALALTTFVCTSLLAQMNSGEKGKTAFGDVSVTSFSPGSASKELIYSGSRLLATEEPCTGGDTQPPTFQSCSAINVAAASQCPYATSAQVNYDKPGAADNCPNVTVACTPAPGSSFTVGTTTINCTATDASNNTATCSFPLTVFSAGLVDDSNTGNVVLFNASTGDFRYCCDGVLVATGRSTPTGSGCNITIDNFKGTRWVHDYTIFEHLADLPDLEAKESLRQLRKEHLWWEFHSELELRQVLHDIREIFLTEGLAWLEQQVAEIRRRDEKLNARRASQNEKRERTALKNAQRSVEEIPDCKDKSSE